MIDNKIIAERIKELRKNLKISQKELADQLGITTAALSAYENAATTPSTAVLYNFAQKLNISIDWLLGLSNNVHGTDIISYTDLINAIDNIIANTGAKLQIFKNGNTFDYGYSSTEKEPCYSFVLCLGIEKGFGEDIDTVVGFLPYSQEFYDFLKKRKEMLGLLKRNTIDNELYSLWLNNEIKKLNFDKAINKNKNKHCNLYNTDVFYNPDEDDTNTETPTD